MKNKDVKKLKPEELNKKVGELKGELMILQGQAKTGTPPKNPGQIRSIKRAIAKIYTINKNKEEK
ncbi:MAG: 50S ribosomal protein L29 [Candidatus Woesearchaeota archaeon]|jgi:large subunit ribosomal protein L29